MTPLLGIGIAGAGYLALKKADDVKRNEEATNDNGMPHPGFAIHSATDHNIVVRLANSEYGNLAIGGHAPIVKQQLPQPVDPGKILATVTGTIVAVVGVVAAVGGGSLAAGASAIAAGVSAGGWITVAILAIVGFLTICFFIAGNEIDDLSKGRDQYRENIFNLVAGVISSVEPVIVGTNKDDANAIARCIAYVIARGFNRGLIAFILPNYRSMFNTVTNWKHVNYWSDRCRCAPEMWNISNPPEWNIPGQPVPAQWGGTTLEAEMFPDSSYNETLAGLIRKGLMKRPMFPGSEEYVADFIGRTLAMMAILNNSWTGGDGVFGNDLEIVVDPHLRVKRLMWIGILGYPLGMPEEYSIDMPDNGSNGNDGHNGISAMNSANAHIAQATLQNADKGLVSDMPGTSGLQWFYMESTDTKQAVIRFEFPELKDTTK